MRESGTASDPALRQSARWLAFAWGLAEATVFFIVPDVFITRIALRDFRSALLAIVYAIAGALVGGITLWFAARHGAAPWLLHAFIALPGINASLVARTSQAWQQDSFGALFTGALVGQPYKLFAVHAGAQGASLPLFVLASAAARFARFTFAAALAWLAGRMLGSQSLTVRLRFHAVAWALFYLIYFIVMR